MTNHKISMMSESAIARVQTLEDALRDMPQTDMPTHHVIHAGIYTRTIKIPTGVVITGAPIKRSTMLIISGDVTVFSGEETLRLSGYHVMPASAGRKQAFFANSDTYLTMFFPTQSKTIAECEDEFTDQAELLMSRNESSINYTYITGE